MRAFLIAIISLYSVQVFAFELNDAHIHYNQDVWQDLSPDHVLTILSDANIKRVIVSSTPTQGTEKLFQVAPMWVIPFLRPYKSYRDRARWFSDPGMIDYVKKHLAKGIYRGFGEFHLFSANKDNTVIRQIMKIFAEKKLTLSAHTDAETIEALFNLQPTLRIIWAHCGFEFPLRDIKRLFVRYASLYCDLSFRNDISDADGKLTAEWKAALEQYASRFLLGMDTYIPSQWAHLPDNADFAQSWLLQLSKPSANLIANGNIERMFPVK